MVAFRHTADKLQPRLALDGQGRIYCLDLRTTPFSAMSKPFVCTGCRIRLAVRPRPTARPDARVQHRDFSQTASYHQNDRPPAYGDRDNGQREDAPWLRRYGSESREAEVGQDAPGALGRYSRQPLRPQQLLQELDEKPAHRHRPHSSGIKDVRHGQDAPESLERHSTQPLRPQQLLQELDEKPAYRAQPYNYNSRKKSAPQPRARPSQATATFMSNVGHISSPSEAAEAWRAMLGMKGEVDRKRAPFPRKEQGLMKKVHQLLRRVVVAYTTGNKGDNATENVLPTPLEFLRVVRGLGLVTPAIWSEILWRLGNGLAMKFHHEDSASQAEQHIAFEELVRLWHETFRAKLTPAEMRAYNEPTPSTIDWSFLPDPSSIVKDLGGSETSFHAVIGSVVPSGLIDRRTTESLADYQSALLVLLNLLKGEPAESSGTSSGNESGFVWDPLVDFFDEIFRHIPKPGVPPAIRSRLEQSGDPALQYYETLVRRFELSDIPPVRTDRGKVARDVRNAKVDALGQPIRKASIGTLSTSLKNDMEVPGTAAPQGSEESIAPAVKIDRASLTEAGFTVVEEKDIDPRVHEPVLDWVRRLGRSIEAGNLAITETCWKEVRAFNADHAGSSSLPLFLYEHFMLAFLALRQPQPAIEAWNAVLESGLQPTVKTWTVMMRGCQRANDPDTMEAFWGRMRDQGVQPDHHAWSVRIFCLIKAKRLDKAFAGLKEMGDEWVAAVRAQLKASLPPLTGKQRLPPIDLTQWTGDVAGVPRPNLIVINSAVSALASKDDSQIPRILSWARGFAIDFDLVTYNALLNVKMRHGETGDAMAILKHMQARSIEPNSTTATVLLSALFQSDYFTNIPHDQQTTKLFSLIAAMEASSPTATLDEKGYALAIDRMLKLHSNTAAARALLQRMSERGVAPTSQIYTILMTSYFDSDPPNFAAADALWLQIQNSNNGHGAHLDTIFYDRMVEAFAKHHATVGFAPMLDFLARMSREGKRPSWRVLEVVARALDARGEFGRLAALVQDVRDSKGMVRMGVRGLVGQNEFWEFVLCTGVLDKEGLRGVEGEQALRKRVGKGSFHAVRLGG